MNVFNISDQFLRQRTLVLTVAVWRQIMRTWLFLQVATFFSLVAFSSTRREQCPRWFNDSNTPRCIADDGISDVDKAKDCLLTRGCCLARKGVCYAMPRKNAESTHPDKTDEEMITDAKDIQKSMKVKTTSRFLPLGPFSALTLPYGGEAPYPGFPKLPVFVCQKRPDFPDNCVTDKKGIEYTRNPPSNIPYCLRIPCNPNQPELENEKSKCQDTPGCFYDKTLKQYRDRFGHSVMPGVPVCQLAIRNAVFLDEAKKVLKKSGSWSPYLNECLLDTFDEVIRTPKEGCRFLSMLKYFKHKPKLAGWKSIGEYDCLLLDACWVKNEGCYYPVNVKQLTVRLTPTTQEEKMSSALYYGRPPCQEFNDKTPKAAIESYHSCLISGCKLDKHAQNSYYNYLFDFGKSMKSSDHWVFWRMVESGKYGAHNMDEYNPFPKQDTTVTPFSLVVSYSSKPGESSLLDELRASGSSSILDMLKSGSGLKIPPEHDTASDPFFQQLQSLQTPCSATFTSFGGRPCGPPKYKPTDVPEHCPYRPINAKDLKALRGSFEGCCDITLCYHPKAEIPTARSGAAAYYSLWSYWTECTTTCGKGTKKRWRRCIGIDQSQCEGKTIEQAACEIQPCSSWGSWGRWSRCHVSCGGGIISRTRSCNPEGVFCPGDAEEAKECNTGFCTGLKKSFGPWSDWKGTCTPCGKTIYRSRACTVGPCTDEELYESRRCPVLCGVWSEWTAFGPCNYDFFASRCQQSRSRYCADRWGNVAECQGSAFEYRDCEC